MPGRSQRLPPQAGRRAGQRGRDRHPRSAAAGRRVKVNEEELRLLTGSDDPDAGGAALLAAGPSLVTVTLGACGSAYRSATAAGFVPAFVVPTVDAIGCGDAFMAGVLVGRLGGAGGAAHGGRSGGISSVGAGLRPAPIPLTRHLINASSGGREMAGERSISAARTLFGKQLGPVTIM